MNSSEHDSRTSSSVNGQWSRKALELLLALGLPIGGIVAPIAYEWIVRPTKRLTVVSNVVAPVLPARARSTDSLRVSFDGIEVRSLWVSVFAVANTGTAPMRADDFEHPLRITLGDSSRIVGVKLIRSEPESLPVLLTHDSSSISVAALLLNPKDAFQLYAYSVGPEPRLAVHARIEGVSAPQVREDTHYRQYARATDNLTFGIITSLALAYLCALAIVVASTAGAPFRPAIVRHVLVTFGVLSLAAAWNLGRVVVSVNPSWPVLIAGLFAFVFLCTVSLLVARWALGARAEKA